MKPLYDVNASYYIIEPLIIIQRTPKEFQEKIDGLVCEVCNSLDGEYITRANRQITLIYWLLNDKPIPTLEQIREYGKQLRGFKS